MQKTEEIKSKNVIIELEDTYTCLFNIPKRDLLIMPNEVPLLTTKDFLFPKDISSMKRAE